MSTRHRIPVLIAAAAASVTMLAGCASSGTVGAAGGPTGGLTTGPATATTSSAATTPTSDDSSSSPDSGSSSSDSGMSSELKQLAGLMTDPGCKEAVNALGDALALQDSPLQMATALPQVITKMRQGASDTQKPAAKAAINKLADDLQNIFDTAKKGGTPDTSMMTSDGQNFGMACVS